MFEFALVQMKFREEVDYQLHVPLVSREPLQTLLLQN